MRVALVSLIALAAAVSAAAQTPDQSAPPAAPPPPAAPSSATPAAPAPSAQAPAAPPATTESAPAAEAAPPASPPPPPAPPTDPTAIALLSVLQHVCIPAANGGNFPQLAKAAGYRKTGDNNWTMRTRDYTITLDDPGSNPTQCHVDVIHPLDLQSPGRPIVIALNDWAGIENGWSLYRNDKNVEEGVQFTTRSWQHQSDDKEESLVFTTKRKPDGSPLRNGVDTSEMIYGVQKITS